jgi:molecular chaperone GrpE
MKKSKTETQPQHAPAEAQPTPTPDTKTVSMAGADAASPAPDEESAAQEDHAAKAQETWDRLLRLTAEFDNFRKRAAREKEEAMRYANHKLLERLLPVLDSFDMAVNAATAQNAEASQSLKDGIALVLQQLRTVLTESGLEEIEAHGKPFDPNYHEAVSQIETDEFEDGHVAQQIRKGYLLRDRLVRPSSVIVAKKPTA